MLKKIPKKAPKIVPRRPIEVPINKNIFKIAFLEDPIVLSKAISPDLALTSIIIDDIILNVKQKNVRDSDYAVKQLLRIKDKPVYEEDFKNYDIDLRRGKEKVEFIENIRKGLTLKQIIEQSGNQEALKWYINI